MEKAKTNLGSPMLHKNKSVMIEGGNIPRARVMNQTIIDQYLMRGWVTLAQHMAAEHLMELAKNAGEWPVGANLSGSGRSTKKDYAPSRAFKLESALDRVRKRYGWFHEYLVREVVLHDWDIEKNEMRMKCLIEALDIIVDKCLSGRGYPTGSLKNVKS